MSQQTRCPQCGETDFRVMSSMPKDSYRARKHLCRNCGHEFHTHQNVTTGMVSLAVYAGRHRGWVLDDKPNRASFNPIVPLEVSE